MKEGLSGAKGDGGGAGGRGFYCFVFFKKNDCTLIYMEISTWNKGVCVCVLLLAWNKLHRKNVTCFVDGAGCFAISMLMCAFTRKQASLLRVRIRSQISVHNRTYFWVNNYVWDCTCGEKKFDFKSSVGLNRGVLLCVATESLVLFSFLLTLVAGL